jgi:hypothetical protein
MESWSHKPLAPTHRRYTAAQKEQAVRLVRQIRTENTCGIAAPWP